MKTFNKIIKKSIKNSKLKVDLKKVRNVEIVFLDLEGNLRQVTVPKNRLGKVVIGGLKCDGSSIGFNDVTNSDMNIIIDKSSIYPLPNDNIMVIANTDFLFDPRKSLLETEKKYCKYSINMGVELEFFMTSKDENFDNLGYFKSENSPSFDCLNDVMSFLEKVNFPIESFHHECGHSQFEINFKYSFPHRTADNIIFIKKVLEFYANRHNLKVTYMPKPFEKECGSGMHTNISVFDEKTNLFYDRNDKFNLSGFAYDFANNIINHIRALAFISNPCENSYERLKFGAETPKSVNICAFNRTSLIRVPKAEEKSTRIEVRLPDATANPYLLFNALVIAGFDENKKEIVVNNVLPKTLNEAKKCFEKDKLLNVLMPEKFFDKK